MSSPNKGGSMWRTEDPKHPHYMPDGMGRDTFITFHNGGFLRKNENVFPKTGVHIEANKYFGNSPSPKV